MSKSKKSISVVTMLADASTSIEQRREFLKMLLADPSPDANAAVQSIFSTLSANTAQQLYEEKTRELMQMLKQIEDGPLRPAAFIQMLPPNGFAAPQAQVILEDGSCACSVVPDPALLASLRRGDRVLLDGRGKAVLHRLTSYPKTGEEALFERRLDDRHVEITLRGHERCVYLISEELGEKLAREEVRPGAALVVNARQSIAYDALPPADGVAFYKHLVREPAPRIEILADIGGPPPCIQEIVEHAHLEMTQPERNRHYGVQRCVTRLLAGVSGSGKTLAIRGMCAGIYQVISDVTGVPVADLPPRIFRLRMPDILNYLLGESDRQLMKFFTDVEALADEPYVTPAGERILLPVIAIIEEIDGLARTRGGHDAVYDRILCTALQMLDTTRPELRDKFIFYLGTTNEPDQIDAAFARRIGANVDRFGRLKQTDFPAVLRTHLKKVPVVAEPSDDAAEIRRSFVREITSWLFSRPGPEGALVELIFAGSTTPVRHYRRDLLTGALVDRAVQEAARAARREELRRGTPGGVTLPLLARGFENQIRALVDQLTEINVRHYLDLPDGVRVATLRRLPQPSLLPQEIQLT